MKAILEAAVVCAIIAFSLPLFSQTQSELNRMSREELAAAEQQLHTVYEKLFDSFDATGREKLASAQKVWLAYREAEAVLEQDQVRGGSAAPTVLNAARAELTRQRTRQLEKLLAENH
jgi:uncharacterized protein YecT (DUF1311 family)